MIPSKFVLDVSGVDPLPTLRDISNSVGNSLGDQTGSFNSFVSLIDESLDSVSNFLEQVAQDNRTQLMLDALLDLDRGAEPPPGLAARVHAGVMARQGQSADQGVEQAQDPLDVLLESVPEVEVPAGLPERTLQGLRPSSSASRCISCKTSSA